MNIIWILSALICAAASFDKNDVVYAKNFGYSRQYVDQYGIVYRPVYLSQFQDPNIPKEEQFHCSSQGWFIDDINLYCSEKWEHVELVQKIPLDVDGKYTLNLKFAEMVFYRPREKVFDIRFGDTIVKGNVDIFREVGFAQPYDLFFEFKLKKGVIYLKNDQEADSAYDKRTQSLVLKITKLIGEPRINGLVVTKGGPERSTKELYGQQIQKINKKIEEIKRHREQILKGDMADQLLKVPFDGEINQVDASDYPPSVFDSFLSVPYLLEGLVLGSVFVFLFFIEKCP